MRFGLVFAVAGAFALAGVPADAVGPSAFSRDIKGLVDAAFGVFSAPSHEAASTRDSLSHPLSDLGDNLLSLDDFDSNEDAENDDFEDAEDENDGDQDEEEEDNENDNDEADDDDDDDDDDDEDHEDDREDEEGEDDHDVDHDDEGADGISGAADLLLAGSSHLGEEVDALVAVAAHRSLQAEIADWRAARGAHHDRIDRRRIVAHNRKVAAFHRLEAARRRMYLAQQKKAREMWSDFNRRQKKEYAKAPKPIVFNHRVKAVVDDMVNRRFKQYTQFFVRHYLNRSPYVDISRNLKNRENRNPAPRRHASGKWFDKLPRGFKKSKKPAEW